MYRVLFSLLTYIFTVSSAVSQNLPPPASQTKVNPGPADSATQLNVPPFFYDNSSAALLTVDENSDVKIECYAGGSPAPSVYITRENDAPLQNGQTFHQGSVLEITHITKKEEGRYRCVANTSSTATPPKHIVVEVRVPPIIHSCILTVNYYPEVNVITECLIESHVTPDIVWFENEHERQYNSSDKGLDFESTVTSNGRLFTATLKIYSMSKNKNTYYSIEANNSLGGVRSIVGKFDSFPNCSSTDCPTSSNSFLIFFTIVVIIAAIGGAVYKYWEKIKNFRGNTDQAPPIGYRVPKNDF